MNRINIYKNLLLIIFISQFFAINIFAQKQNQLDTNYSKKIDSLLNYSEKQGNNKLYTALESARKAQLISVKNNDSLYIAKSLHAIGYLFYNSNNYDSAISYFNNSFNINKKINNKKGMASALNRIGNSLQLKGNYEKALGKYFIALNINKSLNDTNEIARTLTNLGSIYQLFGNYEKAINQHLDALNKYETLKHQEGIAWSSLNIARLFKMMNNYEKALQYANSSLQIYQQIYQQTSSGTGITLCLKEKGLIYQESGEYNKAIEYSKQVLEKNKLANNKYGISNSLANLGKIYFQINKYDTALFYLTETLKQKKLLNDSLDLSSTNRYLGKTYLKTKNYLKAKKHLSSSLKFAVNQNLKEDIKESHLSLSEFYIISKNYKKAFYHFKAYSELKDKLKNRKINELELQYEFDKKQKQIEFEQKQREIEQKQKLQQQKLFTSIFIVGFILMIGLALFIYKKYKKKKQINAILRQQKEEIEAQRDEIETQRDMATDQRDKIILQKNIITDSIEYARRIQNAILPQKKYINTVLDKYFILNKPQNIVSGDFYWLSEKDNKIIIAVADCTGHGVPGAFMSMLGVSFLNEIINKDNASQANKILELLRDKVIETLHQTYGILGSKDGMDIAICIIDKKNSSIQYAGAHNPLYLIRDNELLEFKADKMPIGIHAIKAVKTFTNNKIKIQKGDMLYLFSDGYADQFGGEKGMKFRQTPFKNLLLKIHKEKPEEQKLILTNTLNEWQGDYKQIDDIMILGIQL
ncbi:MAG: tetratricopeptide repeat protein [Bacteroidales bacterium]|jgi:serine phosphatase RsbU (regulator of sigma subunit)/uncharacterized protein HemY|nr:tetratricopeptide repeat protein [Bacteroidales bacterium]